MNHSDTVVLNNGKLQYINDAGILIYRKLGQVKLESINYKIKYF